VYEATHASGERVAVKLLHPAQLDDRDAVRRFRDEAIAGLIIRHPNVVSTIDHGETADGVPFLVMERAWGEPLGACIHRDGALSLRRAVGIARQILSGLTALHAAGIVHGDVKSDNVLVERRDGIDHVRLIDFGLARVQFAATGSPRNELGDLVSGTPGYMAPEVIRGEGSSTASDLYGVGVILYEMITGNTPFYGGSVDAVLRCHLMDQVIPPSLRRADIPTILERIVMRVLDKNPLLRFASAASFGSALDVTLPVVDDRLPRRLARGSVSAPTGRGFAG
jgi:serine/threonine-protein kinase